MNQPHTIYRLCSRAEAETLQTSGVLPANSDDQRDGFLHFSTADQVPGTAAKHYAHVPDLMLIAVETARLGDALRWEVSRNGAKFPHVYGDVTRAETRFVRPVTYQNGQPVFDESLFT